jgi:dephospho-CoA kinase
MSKKVILGFTGLISSGKGTVASYLEKKYEASTYRFSTMLRELLDRIYVEQNRDNIIKISESIRSLFGEDIMAKAMAKDVEKDTNQIVVVEGIRRTADIEYLRQLPHFVLVEIFADPKVRYERLISRGENTDDNSKTYEQFLADHERSTEKSILEVLPFASEHIDNNGDEESLHAQLDELIKKYT